MRGFGQPGWATAHAELLKKVQMSLDFARTVSLSNGKAAHPPCGWVPGLGARLIPLVVTFIPLVVSLSNDAAPRERAA